MPAWTASVAFHLAAATVAWWVVPDMVQVMTTKTASGPQIVLQLSLDANGFEPPQEVDMALSGSSVENEALDRTAPEIEPVKLDQERLRTATATATATRSMDLPPPGLPISPSLSERRSENSRDRAVREVAKSSARVRRQRTPDAEMADGPAVVPANPTSGRRTRDNVNETAPDDARATGIAGIPDASKVDQPPREPAGNAKPEYPARERQLGTEGVVVLRILIDERGAVSDTKIVSGPPAFCRAVLAVVKSWRFEPARHRGHPVKVWGVKEIAFTRPTNKR